MCAFLYLLTFVTLVIPLFWYLWDIPALFTIMHEDCNFPCYNDYDMAS